MVTNPFNVYATATTASTTASTVLFNTSTTTGNYGGISQQAAYGYQQAQNQLMAQQQAAQTQMLQMQQMKAAPTEDEAHEMLRLAGHVVLKKAQRVAHYFPKAAPIDAATPIKNTNSRIVDGYELPRRAGEYLMPDGSVLIVDGYGNYRIEDHEAKVTYQANRVREFNQYINASDLLEKFVAAIGKHPSVDQSNVLKLPVEAFVNWLIREAALKDGDKLDGLPTVEEALPALPAPQAVAA